MARRKNARAVSGWINLDKPYALGSTPAVTQIRRLFNAQKAGHAGTLDPLATGVLPIALGEATKTVSFMQDAAKSYAVTVGFGTATDSDDLEGMVIATSAVRPDKAAISAALSGFIGCIEQVPPQFSAIRKDGQRAYAAARTGQKLELGARRVRIDAITLVDMPDADHVRLEVACGKGVYIRALARDLAHALGTLGHVTALRRTRVGPFCANATLGLDKLTRLGHSAPDLAALDAQLLPLETALDDIPALALGDEDAARMKQGQAISPPNAPDADLVFVAHKNRPLAIGRKSGLQVKPVRVFNL